MKKLIHTKKEEVQKKDIIGKITVLQAILEGLFSSVSFVTFICIRITWGGRGTYLKYIFGGLLENVILLASGREWDPGRF